MQREIDLRRGGRIDAEELRRRHPDHGERHVVDENLLPGGVGGIAEAPLAVAQAEDRDRRGAGAIVVGEIRRPAAGDTASPRKKSPETYSP